MSRYLLLLLFIGLTFGQNLLLTIDKKEFKEKLLEQSDKNTIFLLDVQKAPQKIPNRLIKEIRLDSNKIIDFGNDFLISELEKKVIKKSELVLKKKEKFLRLYPPQKLIINNDIRGAFESITKDHLNINTGFSTRAVPIYSIINISVEDTVSTSFWDGALVGAGACILPIAILSIGNSEAHYGLVFAGIATPFMAVLGGLTSVIFPKRARIKVYTIKENSWVIINE